MSGISSNVKLVNKNLSFYNTLSFDKFNTLYNNKYNTTLDPNWLGWLVGFSEGDGYLGINEDILVFVLTQKLKIIRWFNLYNTLQQLDVDAFICIKLVINNSIYFYSLSFNKFNTLIKRISFCLRISRSSGVGRREDKLLRNILSYNINKRRFSVLSNTKLDPYYITGLTDAEGSFIVKITTNDKCKTGYQVSLVFQIAMHKKDRILIEKIQFYFNGVGSIRYSKDIDIFTVSSKKELEIIKDHFDKYPLITQKWSDYTLFKQCLDEMKNKNHLTDEGLRKIFSIRASINLGLSDSLNKVFLDIVPVLRPPVVNYEIPNRNWLVGFIEGEGCFMIDIFKSKTKIGYAVGLKFQITQHIREIKLMESLVIYLNCGRVSKRSNVVDFIVTKFSDIELKIIPLFETYCSLVGNKNLEFLDFCKAVKIMQDKGHLTLEGLEKIRKIKSGMNTKRKFIE